MPSPKPKARTYALRTKRLALSAILAAMAMIFSYIEALIPLPVSIPGIKLGLANLVIVIAIYRLGFKAAFSASWSCTCFIARGFSAWWASAWRAAFFTIWVSCWSPV